MALQISKTVVRRGRGRYLRITRDKWSTMLQAYTEKATVANVMRSANVGEKLAKRAIYKGWPDIDLPPFKEIVADQNLVHEELAAYRTRLDATEIAKGQAARQAAEEALACQVALRASIRAGQVLQHVLDSALKLATTGKIELPDKLSEKSIVDLARAAQALSTGVGKALEAERMRTGEPDEVMGTHITALLSRCTEDEMRAMATTGKLPKRLVAMGAAPPDEIFEDEEIDIDEDAEDPMALLGGGNR